MPAWIVAKANQYSRDHGKPQFVIYQGEWNVLARDVERDILPLCHADGKLFSISILHFLIISDRHGICSLEHIPPG